MARVVLSQPVAEIHGSFTKGGNIINRQKKYRDKRGRVVHEGKQEAYSIRHPRDFKKNPPKGAELVNISCWTEACRRASQILQAVNQAVLPSCSWQSVRLSACLIFIRLTRRVLCMKISVYVFRRSCPNCVVRKLMMQLL